MKLLITYQFCLAGSLSGTEEVIPVEDFELSSGKGYRLPDKGPAVEAAYNKPCRRVDNKVTILQQNLNKVKYLCNLSQGIYFIGCRR